MLIQLCALMAFICVRKFMDGSNEYTAFSILIFLVVIWFWRRNLTIISAVCVLGTLSISVSLSEDWTFREQLYLKTPINGVHSIQIDSVEPYLKRVRILGSILNLATSDKLAGVHPLRGRILVYISNIDACDNEIQSGDVLIFRGTINPLKPSLHPGDFSMLRWSFSSKFHGSAYIEEHDARIVHHGKRWGMSKIRCEVAARFKSATKGTNSIGGHPFTRALLFGDMSEISKPGRDAFMRTGTIHLLAVSGFQVAFIIILTHCICAFLRRFF